MPKKHAQKPASKARDKTGLDTASSIGITEAEGGQGSVDAGEVLANPRHEAFAQLVAKGADYASAYSQIYPDASRASAGAAGSRLFTIVRDRVTELQGHAASSAVMDLREMLEFLTLVKRTPVGEITADHELAQRYEITEDGKKVWMPDKRACVELAAKLQGMLSEKMKVEHTGEITHNIVTEEQREKIMKLRRAALTGGVN